MLRPAGICGRIVNPGGYRKNFDVNQTPICNQDLMVWNRLHKEYGKSVKTGIRTGENDEYVEIRRMKNNILRIMRYRTLISGIGYPYQSSKKGIDVYAYKIRTKEFMNYLHGLKRSRT